MKLLKHMIRLFVIPAGLIIAGGNLMGYLVTHYSLSLYVGVLLLIISLFSYYSYNFSKQD